MHEETIDVEKGESNKGKAILPLFLCCFFPLFLVVLPQPMYVNKFFRYKHQVALKYSSACLIVSWHLLHTRVQSTVADHV